MKFHVSTFLFPLATIALFNCYVTLPKGALIGAITCSVHSHSLQTQQFQITHIHIHTSPHMHIHIHTHTHTIQSGAQGNRCGCQHARGGPHGEGALRSAGTAQVAVWCVVRWRDPRQPHGVWRVTRVSPTSLVQEYSTLYSDVPSQNHIWVRMGNIIEYRDSSSCIMMVIQLLSYWFYIIGGFFFFGFCFYKARFNLGIQ